MDNQKYELDVELPLLRIQADYNVAGKLVLMPIKGEGPMQANVSMYKKIIHSKHKEQNIYYFQRTVNQKHCYKASYTKKMARHI